MSNESPSHAPKPAPAFEPHMVMARPHDMDRSLLLIKNPLGWPYLASNATITPILTVPLEEAARAVQLAYYRSEYTTDREELWREVALAVCALKVREARGAAAPGPITMEDAARRAINAYDAAEHKSPQDRWHAVVHAVLEALPQAPRALPDRDTLAREMYFYKNPRKLEWDEMAEYTKNHWRDAADRALELCGAATTNETIVDGHAALGWYNKLKAVNKSLTDAVARADKAESEKRSAAARAEEVWKERAKLRGEVNELRVRAENAEKERNSFCAQLILEESNSKALRERAEKAEKERDAERKKFSKIVEETRDWLEKHGVGHDNDPVSMLRTRMEYAQKGWVDHFERSCEFQRQLAALREPSDLTDAELMDICSGYATEEFAYRAVANAAAARARAQVAGTTAGQIVPALPTLAQLEAAEKEAFQKYQDAETASRRVSYDYTYRYNRTKAIFVHCQAEYGRAAEAVDAAREVK